MRVVKNMEKRGWVILVLMVLVSLLWRDWRLTLGVATGGLVALADMWLMRAFFAGLIKKGKGKALFVAQLVKYLVLAVILGVSFFFKLVSPLGVLLGLSLLVLMPIIGLSRLERELEEVA